MKRTNFLIVFNIFFLIPIFICCGARNETKEQKIDFAIEKIFFSDNENSPYFFIGIHMICANSKFIYVSDWKDSSIKIFDYDLNMIKKIGKKGSGPGEFSQIFADLKCNNEKIYLLTINRLYVFSTEGEFEKEIVLMFIPREVFVLKDRLIFRLYSSEKAFFETDLSGKIINKFYNTEIISTEKCKTDFVTPGAFMSSAGTLFIMDSVKYSIKIFDVKTKRVEKILIRKVDFDRLKCRKSRINGIGETYFYSGGYSWFLEGDRNLFYFYHNSKNEMKIDIYNKDSLILEWTGKYTGEFFPLCIHPQNGKFIGFNKDEADKLLISSIKSLTR
jgi:hypothetical protein